VYARPFEAAIRLAGLRAVMNSYSSLDGVPVGASREILTGLLRERLGFTGTVVSDYDTIRHLYRRLGVARDAEEAGLLALAAGVDVELPIADGYGATLADAVRRGVVPAEQLDQACWRVLRDKFALGLFDQPYVNEDPAVIGRTARAGSALSHTLAQQSVTLLKNDGGLLPLSDDVRRIAIVGPHADGVSVAFPAYTFPAMLEMMSARFRGEEAAIPGTEHLTPDIPDEARQLMAAELPAVLGLSNDDYARTAYDARSLADAVRDRVPGAEVTVRAGCGVTDAEPVDLSAAAAAACDADVVILALGGRGGWFTSNATEGEGGDTADIGLPANQVALVRAVAATGTPCVAVVLTGRPMALTEIVDEVPALLYGYYGGQHAATALTEALFGDVNPGGKLPVSIPRHCGQVPVYSAAPTGTGYRRTNQDMHRGYLDMPSTPLFAFGHGLSYTAFEYTDLEISPSDVTAGGTVTVGLTVRNTGERAGDEVVQLYVADQATGVTRPAQELVGFSRIGLEPGAAATVQFSVAMSQLGYVGLDGRLVLEPGPVQVLVGGSSDDIRLRGAFEITGETAVLDGRSCLSQAAVRWSLAPTAIPGR
jgi:beta-glucosidase